MGNIVCHCVESLSTVMNTGSTPMRQLILEIVNAETAGECIPWLLPTAMWVQRRRGEAIGNIVCHCVESLSTTMTEGNTPVRQLILETIDGETVGECVACPLPIGMWVQRRRSEEIVVNGDQHVKALSTVIVKEAHR